MPATLPLEIVVLAAGRGTRMKSALPKVLHPLAGKPLLAHVLDTAQQLEPGITHVVYGHGGEQVPQTLNGYRVEWVLQDEQLGTGHAVACAAPGIDPISTVLVLYGDVPLVEEQTLRELAYAANLDEVALLTVELVNPKGYGRIVRDGHGDVVRIVEEKDASEEQRAIREVNSGILAVPGKRLLPWLEKLDNRNAQGEFYLTDLIAMAVADGIKVTAHCITDPEQVMGVNDRVQLAHLERVYQRRKAEALMRGGLTLHDPERFDLRGTLSHGEDVEIDVGAIIKGPVVLGDRARIGAHCVLCDVEVGDDVELGTGVIAEGRVVLGDRVRIGAYCVLRDVQIGNDVEVRPHSVLEGSVVGAGGFVGPFARLRPGTQLADGVHIGNFVEIKNSQIANGSKVNHLSYIGDTTMGAEVNIGAGTITCNYDGANKHRTVIGDRVFVGSDSQLVAPVRIGDDATIGAGSTITKDAPAGELSLSRSKQLRVRGWRRPVKKPKSDC